jgi:hypothetical protein
MEACQKKYCPVSLENEKIRYQKENEKCKKLFTDYKYLKRYTKCTQRAYSEIAKINNRTEKCLRKNCKRQLKTQGKKVRRLFFKHT